jgi:hypothetical protein
MVISMRFLIIILGPIIILSCANRSREKQLFDILYQNKFSIGHSMTIEYLDSTFFAVMTIDEDSIDGYTLGKWEIEDGLFNTFINAHTFESKRARIVAISSDFVELEFKGKTVELHRIDTPIIIDILGSWKCLNCSPLPPFSNSKSDEMRDATYIFRNDNTFEIEEEDWRANGSWKFSKSGQFIILNKIRKKGDFIEGDLLILKNLVNDTLTINVEHHGQMITRKLIREWN